MLVQQIYNIIENVFFIKLPLFVINNILSIAELKIFYPYVLRET